MIPKRIFNIHAHIKTENNLDERIKDWKKSNVHKVCCLCLHKRWKADGGYFTNEDFLKIKNKYGNLILGMAHLNLFADEIALPSDIERYKEQGFAGLKCLDSSYEYSHDLYLPLYEKAQELKMPILFHTGWSAPLCDIISERKYGINSENFRPFHLDRIARYFPDLKIIGAHLGKPFFHEALRLIEAFPNIYYDFCGGGGSQKHFNMIKRAMMPFDKNRINESDFNPALEWFDQKLVFATDNAEPSHYIPQTEAIMDELQINQSGRENFYWNTAAKIFGIEDK